MKKKETLWQDAFWCLYVISKTLNSKAKKSKP